MNSVCADVAALSIRAQLRLAREQVAVLEAKLDNPHAWEPRHPGDFDRDELRRVLERAANHPHDRPGYRVLYVLVARPMTARELAVRLGIGTRTAQHVCSRLNGHGLVECSLPASRLQPYVWSVPAPVRDAMTALARNEKGT